MFRLDRQGEAIDDTAQEGAVMGSMLVRHEPLSAAVVRREIAADLGDRGFDRDCIDDVALVVSELVSNAVKHVEQSDAPLDVTWKIAETHVLLAVCDPSTRFPQTRDAALDDTSGRGMSIVESLSADWGVQPMSGGKRVWAKLPLRRYG